MSHTPIGFKTALTKRPGSIFILHGKMTGLHWNAESTIWTYWELMKEKNLSELLSLNRHQAIFHPSQLQKDYRRKGIGKSLLKSAVSHFKAMYSNLLMLIAIVNQSLVSCHH